jgi:serine/threonine protein kinase
MKYFQNGDLHKVIENFGPCTESGAKKITMQLLEGLDVMHEMGFTHRDLKPQVGCTWNPFKIEYHLIVRRI